MKFKVFHVLHSKVNKEGPKNQIFVFTKMIETVQEKSKECNAEIKIEFDITYLI